MSTVPRYTVADLDLYPEPLEDTRYEIIDGELHVSRQPTWDHQFVASQVAYALTDWDQRQGLGFTVQAPGVIFSPEDAAVPDVVWVSRERLPGMLDHGGHLRNAPELMVEVLAPGARNGERDRTVKLRQYSRYGVREYWIVDSQDRTVQVFRLHEAQLQLAATLTADDTLSSPLLPGFSVAIGRRFRPSV